MYEKDDLEIKKIIEIIDKGKSMPINKQSPWQWFVNLLAVIGFISLILWVIELIRYWNH